MAAKRVCLDPEWTLAHEPAIGYIIYAFVPQFPQLPMKMTIGSGIEECMYQREDALHIHLDQVTIVTATSCETSWASNTITENTHSWALYPKCRIWIEW